MHRASFTPVSFAFTQVVSRKRRHALWNFAAADNLSAQPQILGCHIVVGAFFSSQLFCYACHRLIGSRGMEATAGVDVAFWEARFNASGIPGAIASTDSNA